MTLAACGVADESPPTTSSTTTPTGPTARSATTARRRHVRPAARSITSSCEKAQLDAIRSEVHPDTEAFIEHVILIAEYCKFPFRDPDLPTREPVPLQVHANYTREEILAAFGASTVTKPLPLQTGVYWHEPTRADLLFITLQKADKDYSPTTRYLDYAISEHLFHWESQAKDTVASERGQNDIHHEAHERAVALFIRTAKKDPAGRTIPYFCAGTATYVEHQSERPIQITWNPHHPLPGDIFTTYRAAIA